MCSQWSWTEVLLTNLVNTNGRMKLPTYLHLQSNSNSDESYEMGHWQAAEAESMNSRFKDRPCLKK